MNIIKIKVDKLSIDNIKDISNLLIENIQIEYSKHYQDNILKYFYEDSRIENIINRFSDNRITYYAIIDNEIIGMISLLNNEIRTFNVSKKYRYQGVGRKLLNKIILENNNKKLKVKSLISAIDIYLSLGFKTLNESEVIKTDKGLEYLILNMYLN